MDTSSEQYFDCVCRTCTNTLAEASSYDANSQPQWRFILDRLDECGAFRIVELLTNTVPQIEVQLCDELPKKICRDCLQQLISAHRFQQSCLQSQQRMRELIVERNTAVRIAITEAATIDQESANEFSQQESVLGVQGNEFYCVNTLTSTQPSSKAHFETTVQPEISADDHLKQKTILAAKKQIIEPELPETPHSDVPDYMQKIVDNAIEYMCNNSQIDAGDSDVEFVENEPCSDADHEELNFGDIEIVKNDPCTNNVQQSNAVCSEGERMHSTASTDDDVMIIETQAEEQVSLTTSTFACHVCNKSYKKPRSLQKHLEQHQKSDTQKEPPKEKQPSKQKKLAKPKECTQRNEAMPAQPMEPNDGRLNCDICHQYFYKMETLQLHRLGHNMHTTKLPVTNQYLCHICKETFQYRSMLTYHNLRAHSKEKPYGCEDCDKSFDTVDSLTEHRLIHNDERPYQCPHCTLAFLSSTEMSKHMASHEITHKSEKPFKCKYCKKRFADKTLREIHLRTHTHRKICKYCERGFRSNPQLINHLRTHLGDDVYRCDVCPAAYSYSSDLSLHHTTHMDDDDETRELNMKALKEAEEKIKLKLKLIAERRE